MKPRRLICTLMLCSMMGLSFAQSAPKPATHKPSGPQPLTNQGVITMVKGGVPESTIITAIQTQKTKFDISPTGLVALHKAGVTQAEMDAIMAASGAGTTGAAAAVPAAAPPSAENVAPSQPVAPAPAPAGPKMPVVTILLNGMPQEIPMEKTQLAQTKTKPTSMTSLAGDSVVTQAMQAGIGTATMSATSHMTSMAGASTIQQAGGIFSGMMAHRKPTVTYVWGVTNPASTNILPTMSPAFTVNFATTPGVNPDDFEPAIVKLTPAQNSCRIVGATQGKDDLSASAAADWQIYSSFLEERVQAKSQKTGSGQYQISPNAALLPGEYAVVLRPVSKSKKFSGGDVARGQGDGLMFDSVWSFQVSNDAH
jgi:hypothetical protein